MLPQDVVLSVVLFADAPLVVVASVALVDVVVVVVVSSADPSLLTRTALSTTTIDMARTSKEAKNKAFLPSGPAVKPATPTSAARLSPMPLLPRFAI